jgi:hypothetical protein
MQNKSSKIIKEVVLSNFDRKICIYRNDYQDVQIESYDYNKDYSDLEEEVDEISCFEDNNGKVLNPVYESIFNNYPTINLSLLTEYFEKVKRENPEIDPTEIVLTCRPSCYASEAGYRISHFRPETDQEYQERISFYEMKKLQRQKEKEEKKKKAAENKRKQYEKLKEEFGD